MSGAPFSLSEFSEFLDDSDGHRLAQFLQKKSGDIRQGARRIFDSEPDRFSLNVRLRRVSTPPIPPQEVPNKLCAGDIDSDRTLQKGERNNQTNEIKKEVVDLPESSTTEQPSRILESVNPKSVCDPNSICYVPLPVREKNNGADQLEHISQCRENSVQDTSKAQVLAEVPVSNEQTSERRGQLTSALHEQIDHPSLPQLRNCVEEQRRCVSPLPAISLPATPRSVRFPSPRSPISKVVRSGGISSADRLRRQVLKRRSTLSNSGKRTLLKEFESTISSSDFAPPICSTPMSHRQSNSPAGTQHTVEDLQRPSINCLTKQDEALIKSMVEQALEESIKKLKNIENIERTQTSVTPEESIRKQKNVINASMETATAPNTNAPILPETQELLQQAQNQISSSSTMTNKSHAPITQELLQEVQNALKDIRKSQAQVPKIVIPVNQTFNNAPPPTREQSYDRELLQYVADPEKTLNGTMVRNSSIVQLHDTLTQSRSSRRHPDTESIGSTNSQNVSKCDNSHAFVNHPTFTHNSTPNVDRSQRKHNSNHTKKVAETFRCHTHHEYYGPGHSIIQDPAVSMEDQCPSDSRSHINRHQNSAKHNTTHATKVVDKLRDHTQLECCSPGRSIIQNPAASMKAKVSMDARSNINREHSSTKHNNTPSNKMTETFGEHTHAECSNREHTIIQDPAVPMKAMESNSQMPQNSTTHNKTEVKKVGEMSREHTHVEYCSPGHIIIHDPAGSMKGKELNASRKSVDFIEEPIVRSLISYASADTNQNLATDDIANQTYIHNKSPGRPRRSILKNRNLPTEHGTSSTTRNENKEIANSTLITEDEDANESHIYINKRRVSRKSGPLNLAPERHKPVTRSKRKRKCTLPPTTTVTSPLLTSDTDADTGLPPAHPLNLRHTRRGEYILQQQLKRPLNKPPNTPKNGEKFAEELKAHLARLTNHEILDLRKRNSIGDALVAPTRLRRSAVSVERALHQQLQIEEQIQLEILRRELLGEAEGLQEINEHNKVSLTENNDVELDDIGILGEFDELPSAPDVFKDNDATNHQQLLLNVTSMQSYNSSLIDDNSAERVTFVQPNNNSVQVRKSRSRKKKSEELPEITKRYMEIQKKVKKRRQPNISKRSLYSKGDSTIECEERQDNVSSEKENFPQSSVTIEAIPPPPVFSPVRSLTNLHIPSPPPPLVISPTPNKRRPSPLPSPIYSPVSNGEWRSTPPRLFTSPAKSRESSLLPPPQLFSTTSSRETSSLPPPPAPFLDNCNNNTADVVNTTTVSTRITASTSTQVAGCQTDDDLFKRPTMPAPRGRSRKRKITTCIETSRQIGSREIESSNDAEGLRRSKRGQVPRKQSFLCGTSNGPPLLYSLIEAAEKRACKSREKRLEKIRTSKSINNDFPVPVVSSTVKKATKKARGRPLKKAIITEEHNVFSYLGETNTTSGTICSTKSMNSNTVTDRLQAIEETSTESDGEVDAPKSTGACIQTVSESETPAINTQNKTPTQAEEIDNDAILSAKSKPKAGKKNKKQKRKVRAKINRLPLDHNAAITTVTTVTEDIPANQSANDMATMDRIGVLELSRVNGPPPPPRDKLNEIFNQLKNAANNLPELHSDASSSSSSTNRTRNLRVRVHRLNMDNATSSAASHTSTSSNNSTRPQTGAQNELYTWLRNVTHSSESATTKDIAIFREMRASTAGNLYFTDLEGVDYAFYDTDDKSSLGYLRFQPLQHKPSKRAKKYNLHFIVLAGTFRIGTDNEHGIFGVGDMIAINTGKRYNITNMENDIGILMVIKK